MILTRFPTGEEIPQRPGGFRGDRAVLVRLRKELESERKVRLAQLADFVAMHAVAGMHVDRTDGNQTLVWGVEACALQWILEDIEEALDRMSDGSYGLCAYCGDRIPLKRLRVMPYSHCCVRCVLPERRHRRSGCRGKVGPGNRLR